MTDTHAKETERKEVPVIAKVKKRQALSASGAEFTVTVPLLSSPPFPQLTWL